jgi:hypothetical protein
MEEWEKRIRVLDAFTMRNRFDLYHQSPWVAGASMSAVLATAQHFGPELLNQGGVFGSLLHLYNMLRHVDFSIPEIPVLEKLCDVFFEQVFMDKTRPTSRFATVLDVFLGADLVHRNGQAIVVPSKYGKGRDAAFSPNARIKPESTCMFTHQLDFDSLCGVAMWNRIADELVTMQSQEKEKMMKIWRGAGLKERLLQQFPLSQILRAGADVMAEEFSGDCKYFHDHFLCISPRAQLTSALRLSYQFLSTLILA